MTSSFKQVTSDISSKLKEFSKKFRTPCKVLTSFPKPAIAKVH